MPMDFMDTPYGPVTYVEDLILKLGSGGNQIVMPVQITKFTRDESLITFFGKDKIIEELEATPTPRDYFKKFRGDRYIHEIQALQKSDLDLETRRDLTCEDRFRAEVDLWG